MTVAVSLKFRGDTKWISDAATRARGKDTKKSVVDPWRKWITQVRVLKMYRDKGVVRTPLGAIGQRWEPNAALTVAVKKHSRPMLSERQFQFGTMARSYVVDATISPRALKISAKMTNKARAKSGFDYPSYLHKVPSPHKPIRPIDAQVLRITGPGGTFFRMEVERPPSRPHIFFTDDDAEQLSLRLADWIIFGKKSGHRRRV